MHQNNSQRIERISTMTEPSTAVNGPLPRSQQGAASPGHNGSLLQNLILEAISFAAQEQNEEAISALGQALDRAEGKRSIRRVLAQGTPKRESLGQPAAHGAHASVHLLEVSGEPVIGLQPLIAPVSPREMDVLREVAAGCSNQEIAEDLGLSVGTVKKHVSNIYGKLGVRSRTQAVARATGLRIL